MRRELPSFFVLCLLEVEEMHGVHTNSDDVGETFPAWIKRIPAPLLLCFCLLGLGHLLTRCGRRAMYVVLWKYYRFILLCFGYWSEDLRSSLWCIKCCAVIPWHGHTEYKMNQGQSQDIEGEFEEEDSQHFNRTNDHEEDALAKTETEESDAKEKSNVTSLDAMINYITSMPPLWDVFNWQLHHAEETQELCSLPYEELKAGYTNDYAEAVSSMVATRATLLQVVPALAVISVFADLMSQTPLLVSDRRLHLSLPELMAKDPLERLGA